MGKIIAETCWADWNY